MTGSASGLKGNVFGVIRMAVQTFSGEALGLLFMAALFDVLIFRCVVWVHSVAIKTADRLFWRATRRKMAA